jgi:hypothetical protein
VVGPLPLSRHHASSGKPMASSLDNMVSGGRSAGRLIAILLYGKPTLRDRTKPISNPLSATWLSGAVLAFGVWLFVAGSVTLTDLAEPQLSTGQRLQG